MNYQPIRIQLRRTKGWRVPANTIKCDRSTMWGNPFSHPDSAVAVRMFRVWLTGGMRSSALLECEKALPGDQVERRDRIRAEVQMLAGSNLACWCPPGAPCHADVLLEIANP